MRDWHNESTYSTGPAVTATQPQSQPDSGPPGITGAERISLVKSAWGRERLTKAIIFVAWPVSALGDALVPIIPGKRHYRRFTRRPCSRRLVLWPAVSNTVGQIGRAHV